MTAARQWTREELDRVHPLPEGWTWQNWGDDVPLFVAVNVDGRHVYCSIDGTVHSALAHGSKCHPFADVCLPVILASKGLDSLGAMADALAEQADAAAIGQDQADDDDVWTRAYFAGCETALVDAAAMLRRGTVAP